MSTYTKATDFLAKDSLPLNNAAKYVKGSEIDTEFDAIETADADNMKKSAMGTGVETFLATPSSANLAAAVTGETGSGALVFATSPTLVTPALGTPASGTLTNCTGLPAGSITGLGAGIGTFLATPSSANLAAAVTDETGSGKLVFDTSPTLVTPTLGVASATSINKVAITAPASGSTLAIADGKTLTVSNTMTLTGTDSTSYNLNSIGISTTLGTPTASTSGTSISYSSLPSGIKKLSVLFHEVSIDATGTIIIQIGDNTSGLKTSGYSIQLRREVANDSTSGAGLNTGFGASYSSTSFEKLSGEMVISLISSADFRWVCNSQFQDTAGATTEMYSCNGTVDISAVLDRVTITTVAGTANFDSGQVNISYSL